jgi:hypothetical protein
MINNELARQHPSPFNYRISMDYGVLDLALVGSTINLCSNIISLLSIPNQLIIRNNLYRILKYFPTYVAVVNNYYFINNREYKIY